ncbi:uridylate-specific endoribonuclease A [Oncorhynchus kisutch]|uniref:uridylate-specific endoribonuclease A n=1 Tax=Oncorhynchus kisutch TaxID=8019 RepID=UPI00099FD730|nr:poly(U)-specific endoribonuclease-like [Oncorhynchus kisutch]
MATGVSAGSGSQGRPVCDGAEGRCDEKYNSQNKCHCNSKCSQYDNCCNDYVALCNGERALVVEIPAVTSLIPSLSKALYALESNKPSASELIIDSQARVPVSQTCSQNNLCEWTSYPDVLGMQFTWDGYFKQVGSAIIGCSSELAMYSLCYITRPGKQCKQSLGGKPLVIQTYTWEHSSYGNGKKYIGSAFPAMP